MILPPCDRMIPVRRTAEMALQKIERLGAKVTAGLDAEPLHLRRRHRPDPVEARHRQRFDPRLAHVGRHRELSVGLAMVRREFRQEFVVRYARRCRQPGLRQNARADFLGGQPGGRDPAPVGGHIQIRLIKRQRLDEIAIVGEDRVDLLRDGAVHFETRPHEHQIGATPERSDRRQRGLHPEGARLIARRRHHAARGAMPDRDRLAAERRIVALLHRGEERVHVDMDDLPDGGLGKHARGIARVEQRENKDRRRYPRLGYCARSW